MTLSLVVTSITLVAALSLLVIKTRQRLSYLLPLVALVPIVVAYLGYPTGSRITAYVLLGLTIILESVRLLRPSFNRRLARLAPELFAEREIVRPLGVSGAVVVITLLVHLETPATLIVAGGFGILAVSVAKALQSRLPLSAAPLWRTTSRGFALYLAIALVGLLPMVALLSWITLPTLLLTILVAWTMALVPLPVDRYALTPLVIALFLYVIA